jgi:hypothetical protein
MERFLWHDNLLHAIRTRPVIVLHGNVRDQYTYIQAVRHHEEPLDKILTRLLHPEFGPIRCYDPYSKAEQLSLGDAEVVVQEQLEEFGAPGLNSTVEPSLARILADMENVNQRRIWLLKYAHNTLPYRSSYSQEEGMRLVAVQRMIERLAPGNRPILSYLSDTQVPLELIQNSHRVAFVKIPLPDFHEREAFWTSFLSAAEWFLRSYSEPWSDQDFPTRTSRNQTGLFPRMRIGN